MKVIVQIEVEYSDSVPFYDAEAALTDYIERTLSEAENVISMDDISVEESRSPEKKVGVCVLSDGETWTELSGCCVTFVSKRELEILTDGSGDPLDMNADQKVFYLHIPDNCRALADYLEDKVYVALPRDPVLADFLEENGHARQAFSLRPTLR